MQTLVRHASVKRFHPSDQIVHFLNLICWAALAASGIALGSAARASIRPERLDVSVHFIAGFALIIVIAAWLVFSPARARRFVHEILRTDRPFLAWLRNLGGYPTKLLRFLRLTKAEPSTAPQGRYNAGQRIAYALLVLLNLTLIGTSVLLFILHQPHEQSPFYQGALAAHSFAVNPPRPIINWTGLPCLLPARTAWAQIAGKLRNLRSHGAQLRVNPNESVQGACDPRSA